MGKTVKTVLKVAAFVAIATFAAPVAGAIGLSSVVGSVVGSAVVGAAMGAATNAVLGGSVWQGALMGGVGGGLGGLTAAAQAPPAAITANAANAANAGGMGAAGAELLAAGAAPLVAPGTAATAAGLSSAMAAPATLAGGGLSAALEGAPIVVTAPSAAHTGLAVAAPTATNVGTGIATAGGAGVPQVQGQQTQAAPQVQSPSASPVAGIVHGVLPRVGDVARAVAPNLIASAVSGNAQSEALAQQAAALKAAQRQYDANFNLKTQYAQGLIDDAGYYDPVVMGTNAAEAARVRAGLQGRSAAREAAAHSGALSGTQAAIQRQAELAGGRQATADYWSAYGTGAGARTNTRAAGINAIPLPSQPSQSDYSYQYQAAQNNVGGTADLISRGLGAWYGRSTGDNEFATSKSKSAYV